MNCAECKEILVAYLEELLAEDKKLAVTEHLKDCHLCQEELKQLTKLQERLVSNGKAASQSDLENEVLNRIIRQQKLRLNAAEKAGQGLKLRRLIMKNSVTRIAVAAVVIIVAAIGIFSISRPSITFAQVIEPILNARIMVFDFVIGRDETGPTMRETFMGQLVRRTMSNVPGMTMIIDTENAKMLVLTDEDKSATYVDIQGQLGDRTKSYVGAMRKILADLKNNHKSLGEQQLNGQKTIVFEAGGSNEIVKVWADPETALPLRIELNLGQMFVIMKNFQFDPALDQSLVSMKVPAGYALKETGVSMGNATEADFIESLRIWAKVIGDGTFPQEIGTEQVMKQITVLGQKMMALGLSQEQASQMGMNFGKGMLFHQILETGKSRWGYTGQGVKLGDASKAVFWYQPEGSETCRVIYGDLSVKDVSKENLPK
ncbi:MAG: zf-HC2 domain-containing protein [Sedimentisphaerales bacterium]|nr:zf-HC2 domain-containing protein [Sedimentisphaerales bacterium]